MIWWEDFKVGDVLDLGRHTFRVQEIIAFGRQFEAANQTGELVPMLEGRAFFGRKPRA